MKKLFQINVSVNSGSTGRIVEGIGALAQKNGYESWAAWGRTAMHSQLHLVRIGTKFNYMEHGAETRIFDNHGLASRSATRQLIREMDKIKPDIIHLHNIHGYFLNYPLLFDYLRRIDVPVVWTLHDCWSFTGHCAHFDSCGCDRWKTGCHHCPQKMSYPASYLFDQSRKNYEEKQKWFTCLKKLHVISVSHWLDNLVGESFLHDQYHTVIYNGIDTDTFSPSQKQSAIRRSLQITDDQIMLLGVASVWGERKGLKDFIELSKSLSPQQKIVLIGLTKKQIQNLPSNIIGIERTESAKQLAGFYSAADVVLNLSKEESFGLTTIEGFSCGTPGIGYNCTATPELFSPTTGYVVPSGNISEILSCIELIQKRGKKFYSSACRNYALAHFRKEDCFSKYIDLYDAINR